MNALEVSAEAFQDVQDILAFYDDRPALRNRIAEQIEQAVLHLCEWPYSGHTRHILIDEDVLFWLTDPYFLIYRTRPETVHLIAVLHTARDIKRILRTRPFA